MNPMTIYAKKRIGIDLAKGTEIRTLQADVNGMEFFVVIPNFHFQSVSWGLFALQALIFDECGERWSVEPGWKEETDDAH